MGLDISFASELYDLRETPDTSSERLATYNQSSLCRQTSHLLRRIPTIRPSTRISNTTRLNPRSPSLLIHELEPPTRNNNTNVAPLPRLLRHLLPLPRRGVRAHGDAFRGAVNEGCGS